MEAKIIHEAEVHRQHVRLKIPIGVDIDGTVFTVDDWSMGGFGIERGTSARLSGERFPVRLVFPFEDFEVVLRLDCEMVYIDDESTRFGCRFLDLSQGQLSLFRYLVDAYLSGELVSAGDLLNVAGRENSAQARSNSQALALFKQEESFGRKVRRIVGLCVLGLVGLGLAALLYLGIKDRFFTVKAATAVIEAPVFALRAPIAGTVQPIGPEGLLSPGVSVASLRGGGGQSAVLESPCECVVSEWLIRPGQFAQQGETVAVLVSADQPLLVRARVEFERAQGLQAGDLAEIRIPGREGVMRGQIEHIRYHAGILSLIEGHDAQSPSRQLVQVMVRPDEPFEFEDLGSMVTVWFP